MRMQVVSPMHACKPADAAKHHAQRHGCPAGRDGCDLVVLDEECGHHCGDEEHPYESQLLLQCIGSAKSHTK